MKNWILYLFKLPLILHLFDYLKILKKEKKEKKSFGVPWWDRLQIRLRHTTLIQIRS